jgi:hypothetical protein
LASFLKTSLFVYSQKMARVAEDIGIIGDADRLVVARRKAGAGDDDVHGAELEALVDIGFFSKL